MAVMRVNMSTVEDAAGYVHRVMDTELPYSVQDSEAEAASEIAFSLLAEWTVCLWLCARLVAVTNAAGRTP